MATTLNLSDYAGYNLGRVSSLQGYDAKGNEIDTALDAQTGVVTFASVPATVSYIYSTGLRNETMDVELTLNGKPAESGGGDSGDPDTSGGGGCEAGFGLGGLVASLLILRGARASRRIVPCGYSADRPCRSEA
jgi:hypothetical protein